MKHSDTLRDLAAGRSVIVRSGRQRVEFVRRHDGRVDCFEKNLRRGVNDWAVADLTVAEGELSRLLSKGWTVEVPAAPVEEACVADSDPDGLWGCSCSECSELQREASEDLED